MLSVSGWQSVTYHCRNSVAWEDDNGNGEYSIILKGDNEVKYHALSPRKLRPNVLIDDCKVSHHFSLSYRMHITLPVHNIRDRTIPFHIILSQGGADL